ncbi:MAG: glutamine--fructose-6-phosphate transaminase (isomerizing) [Actinomycetes bacterium]|jgi:glucosamine--fructose-6-phosphate aminotransferase (isomerizing)|nr:glutamine--fructose-6-phosphate transaminase (isomerizing) [Actinomycetes bacterium]
MCGIVGYVGEQSAADVLFSGLARLEYRGYDSWGIALAAPDGLQVRKKSGKLAGLRDLLATETLPGTVGIGHTRWATHGRPDDVNAHPHLDCHGHIAIVHNGIIENYVELREELRRQGHTFVSQTDTEVIVHLLERELADPDALRADGGYVGEYARSGAPDALLTAAVAATIRHLDGAYALAVLWDALPDCLVAARKGSPLIIGLGQGENLIASDIPAVLAHTRRVAILNDGDLAVVRAGGVEFLDGGLTAVTEPEIMEVEWSLEAAEKGGYEDFMLKEIHEQPTALRATLQGRFEDGRVQLSELTLSDAELAALERVFIIACGTSYHAGLVAKTLIEKWARIPVEVQVSSEFRYSDPLVDARTLVIAITQSGETIDTLFGVREARAKGAKAFAVTNVVGSSVTRPEAADGVVYTHAGPEIGVAATKTFTAQIAALNVLALKLAQARGTLTADEIARIFAELNELPGHIEQILLHQDDIRSCAESGCCVNACTSLFLGRGVGVPIAMEGALKLKEISYIHAEAYAAGEMKHGPIALIDASVPVVGVATDGSTYEKVVSNIKEVQARDAIVVVVASEGNESIRNRVDHVFYVPRTSELLSPIVATVPLQLFAYYIAKSRGCDVDQPRNLAKSVTVE